jgi:DNA-binding transcriptional regulator YiaG
MGRSTAGSLPPNRINSQDSLDLLQADLGLSAQDLATILGISLRTLGRWRSGMYILPQGETRKRLEDLLALRQRVHETVREDATREWLNTRRSYLGNLTPVEVIRAGRADRVLELLNVIDHGLYA